MLMVDQFVEVQGDNLQYGVVYNIIADSDDFIFLLGEISVASL